MDMKFIAGLSTLALFAATPAQAGYVQNLGHFVCDGSMDASLGDAFSIACSGNLMIDRSSVIQAAQSISISAERSITLWGTLVAPRIVLRANQDLSIGGGLFSGKNDAFPEVTAISRAAGDLVVRGFGDLISNPEFDPVYGAVVVTQFPGPLALINLQPAPRIQVLVLDSRPVLSVPEPQSFALAGLGIALLSGLSWTGRRRRRIRE